MQPITRFLFTIAIVVTSGQGLAHGAIDEQLHGMDLRVAENPSEHMLYLFRADLHREHRDWGAATSDIQLALELEPDNPNIDFYRGVLLPDLGKLSEAERAF